MYCLLNARTIYSSSSLYYRQHVEGFFILFLVFYLCIFCPGTMTTDAESINSDLQRGLDLRLRHTQH